jgi:hypothetical protein
MSKFFKFLAATIVTFAVTSLAYHLAPQAFLIGGPLVLACTVLSIFTLAAGCEWAFDGDEPRQDPQHEMWLGISRRAFREVWEADRNNHMWGTVPKFYEVRWYEAKQHHAKRMESPYDAELLVRGLHIRKGISAIKVEY